MVDTVTKAQRSRIMSRIGRRDTGPEIVVRRICTAHGARYRLHRKDLPGTPDLVFASRGLILFVHGCFWHRHASCRLATTPKTHPAFWREKFQRNRRRDRAVATKLRKAGWRVEVVWECETRDASGLDRRLAKLLAAMPACRGRRSRGELHALCRDMVSGPRPGCRQA
jgi:DNA mismatch endonuclease (patch repair protein)